MVSSHQRLVSTKWVFTCKYHAGGEVTKRKARFVVVRFSQFEGVDFTETFAPMSRFTSLMIFLGGGGDKRLQDL